MAKLNNRPNQFFNSCNTMLSYYNNANSRTRGLTSVQQYNNFAELSVDMRNQVICQIMTCVLGSSYARFDGDGKLMNDTSEEVESFISLGIDMIGNEYFVLYPDVLLVLSPSEKLHVFHDGQIKVLQDLVSQQRYSDMCMTQKPFTS